MHKITNWLLIEKCASPSEYLFHPKEFLRAAYTDYKLLSHLLAPICNYPNDYFYFHSDALLKGN